MSDDPRPLERLEEAFDAYLEFDEGATSDERERFLHDHGELRDLLEPMIGADGEPEPLPADGETTLGDFRLLCEIGRGGMGVVHEAWQISLRRRVAVKVLPASLVASPRAIVRFRREAEIMGYLDHPGLVKVYSVGQEGDALYYAMELIDGAPLSERAAGSVVRPEQRVAARLVRQVAEALEHVHRLGVVHRDVKPANILVRPDGTPVLTDFGLARHDALPSMTRAGDFAGTPYYAAPEQAAGQLVDARSDVFALGATLYELLTGRRAFAADTTQGVLDLIRKRDPVDPRRLSSSLSRDLSAIVMKALAKEPHARYQSAGEMADDLRAYEEMRPVRARPLSAGGRLLRWARREPLRATFAAVVGAGTLLVSVLGGYLLSTAEAAEAGAVTLHARKVEDHLASGFVQLAVGYLEGALPEFEAARSLQPDSIEALAGVAISHLRRNAPAEAVAALQRAPELAGSLGLRRLLRRARQEAELEVASDSPELDPVSSPLDHFVVGLSELERGRRDSDRLAGQSALRHFRRAVLGSEHARALYCDHVALAAGDTQDREAALEAADILEHLWPDEYHTWFHVCYALTEIDPMRAVRAGERAIAQGPPSGDPAVYSTIHNNLGNAWSKAGDFERAVASWQLALEANPRNVRACYNLGTYHDRAGGDAPEALRQLQRAVEIDPGYAKAWQSLGQHLLRSGDRPAALDALRRAVAAGPRHVNSRYALARELSRAGNHDEAIEHLQAAVEVAPDSAGLWYALGNALRHVERGKDAVAALERAAELEPTNPVRHINPAGVLLELDRHDEAIVALRKALALRPVAPQVHFNLGLTLLSARQYAAGEQHLAEAIALDPSQYAALVRKTLLEPDGTPHRLHYDAALCRAALGFDPGAQWAHEELVAALLALADHGALRRELCRWAELRADDGAAWRALAEHCLAADLPDSLYAPAAGLRAARRATDDGLIRRATAATRRALGDG